MVNLRVVKDPDGRPVRAIPGPAPTVSTGEDAVSLRIKADQAANQAFRAAWELSRAQVSGMSTRADNQHTDWGVVDAKGGSDLSGTVREV
ncbi:Pc22g18450 protein [Mycolicibacterium fortuitum subsp. acetamidolyticum]|uniref:Pc22g18450 protein n=1 Tax=Mycolicibacterium fortuitum subsp. acetamidolyticum TaxID=144550 RepID=A0A100WQA9_MYCFO|nr:Pc22g18450 protein [Mycolicibacterium fortuitum subsp. acetamidolyticum]